MYAASMPTSLLKHVTSQQWKMQSSTDNVCTAEGGGGHLLTLASTDAEEVKGRLEVMIAAGAMTAMMAMVPSVQAQSVEVG